VVRIEVLDLDESHPAIGRQGIEEPPKCFHAAGRRRNGYDRKLAGRIFRRRGRASSRARHGLFSCT